MKVCNNAPELKSSKIVQLLAMKASRLSQEMSSQNKRCFTQSSQASADKKKPPRGGLFNVEYFGSALNIDADAVALVGVADAQEIHA